MYWTENACVIISVWVILEVLIAGSVKADVVCCDTMCLVEFHHPFFFSTTKLEVVGSSIFMVEKELFASSETFASFHQTSYSKRWYSWITEELCKRCQAACTLLTFNGWMGQCCPIKCTSFSSKGEITHSGNLKSILLSSKQKRCFPKAIQ